MRPQNPCSEQQQERYYNFIIEIIIFTAVEDCSTLHRRVYIYTNSKLSYTKVNSHIKYLIHIYLYMFQVSVCNKAVLCEKALTKNLEIAKIESLSVDDIMRTKNASVIKFVFHSCLKYIFLISL